MQYVNEDLQADCSRSDAQTKQRAARSDPAPASGYLTPHPDFQNKILSASYANAAAAAAARRDCGRCCVSFPPGLFGVEALKVVRRRRK